MKVSIRKLMEQVIRDDLGITAKQAAKASERFSQLIIAEIKNNNSISIPEIGKLIVKKYAAGQGYCPVREAVVPRGAYKAVRFLSYTASRLHAEHGGV